ncbi:MAG TPA: RNA-binding protein [Methylomirabilota bacterium]|jgi:RNA recognition motif-containing protein|nr:RNA-binding protein [Methylomirabilota bacterium]
MATRVFVGNLSYSTTSETLRKHMSQCGGVTSAQVISDTYTGRSRGYGFVEMSSEAEASAAVAQLNGQALEGRSLKVELAKPRPTERSEAAAVGSGPVHRDARRWRSRRGPAPGPEGG